MLTAPWVEPGEVDGTNTQVVLAADTRGLVAVACYEAPVDGIAIPALGLVASPVAAPVMRGETRLRPGAALPAAAPIALRIRAGVVDVALGVAGANDPWEALQSVMKGLAERPTLAEALAQAPRGRALGVVVTRENATALGSA